MWGKSSHYRTHYLQSMSYQDNERRKRDSNPRYGSPYSGFQGQNKRPQKPTQDNKSQ